MISRIQGIRLPLLVVAALLVVACDASNEGGSCASVAECGAAERCVDGRCTPIRRDDAGESMDADVPPVDGAASDDASLCVTGEVVCGDECAFLATDVAHCGRCDRPCALPNAEPRCAEGLCRVARCRDGYADCDGDPTNGCEVIGLCPCGNDEDCGAGRYCHAASCHPEPVLRLETPNGDGCTDYSVAHQPPSFARRFTVTGRPGATITQWRIGQSCDVPAGIIGPPGESSVIGPTGDVSWTAHSDAATCDTNPGYGSWVFWSVVDGRESNRVTARLYNSSCPAFETCALASSFCSF